MPIFEYQCNKCGEIFSVLKLGSADVDTKCTKCGSKETAKKVSSFCSINSGGSGGMSSGGG